MSYELINMCKYSMKTIGSLISGDFYYLYHYISGYVLLPIRLLLLFLIRNIKSLMEYLTLIVMENLLVLLKNQKKII